MGEGLTADQEREVDRIAEVRVRRYFDNYLLNVFPVQVSALIDAHNQNPEAHGGVEKKVSRMMWMAIGAGFAIGAAGGSWLPTLLRVLV